MPEETLLKRLTLFAYRANILFILSILSTLLGCSKVDEFIKPPDLGPLDQGFKSTAAIAYCASLASRAFNGETLPANVLFEQTTTPGYSGSGLLYISVNDDNPLPLNDQIGNIVIAGLWDGTRGGGVISIIFADIDILSGESKFYGIHTIPVIKKNTGELITLFAEQDIVIGEGSDTLLQLGLSKLKFDSELERANSEHPSDVFVAITQNVWHITLHENSSTEFGGSYTVTGGGQLVSASNASAGVLYHAMINTEFDFNECPLNPITGTAFIQNLQAGSALDLGNILMEFHSSCSGKAEVKLATGKYVTANGKDLSLNWN
jgi:hypothetical protein